MKWQLTRLSGINVFVHWTFWLLPIWFGLGALSAGGGLAAVVATLSVIFALFGCVVLHEMGHALAARYFGIGTRDITLYPIGGVASLERIPAHPLQELVIAIAGPLVNVVIAALLGVAIAAGPGFMAAVTNPIHSGFLVQMLVFNVMLVVFNLLPAFPMDGGRVLRALLATMLPYVTATTIAGRIGQGVAILLGIAGILLPQLSLTLIAVFVFLAAGAEIARVNQPSVFQLPAPPPLASRHRDDNDDTIVWLSDVRPYTIRR